MDASTNAAKQRSRPPRASRPVRVAVVGSGYLGRFHAEKYAAFDGVDLAGIVDVDYEKAAEVAAQCKTRAFCRHADLIGRVDAASIVVPTPLHFAIAGDLLKNGIDVLIEKPMTTTLAEARELIAIAETEGLILQVGHHGRIETLEVAHLQNQTLGFSDSDQFPRFRQRRGHGFFNEHVDTVLQKVAGDSKMQRCGHDNADGIDMADQIRVPAECPGLALGCHFSRFFVFDIRDAHQINPVEGGVFFGMEAPQVSRTHHRHTNRSISPRRAATAVGGIGRSVHGSFSSEARRSVAPRSKPAARQRVIPRWEDLIKAMKRLTSGV